MNASAGDAGRLRRGRVALTLAGNALILGCVLVLGWSVFAVVFLYWLENVLLGAAAVVRMLSAQRPSLPGRAAMAGFFCVHYGVFCLVHGIFVFILFSGTGPFVTNADGVQSGDPDAGVFVAAVLDYGWAAAGLALSIVVDVVRDHFLAGAYKTADAASVMARMYGRIIVLHVALLGGGFLLAALGTPLVGLVLLIVLKTAYDLGAQAIGRTTPRTAA